MGTNSDPRKNPITTIPGICFIVLGFFMYLLPMFIELRKDFTEVWYVPLLVICLGVVLIYVPDSLAKAALGFAKRKTGDNSTDEQK